MRDYQHDTLLLNHLQQGNEQAVRHLFNQYYPSLRYYANTIVNNAHEAEDIAIHAFQKFLEKKHGFSSLLAIRTYLFTTVKNAGIDYLRKEQTRIKNAPEVQARLQELDENAEQKMLEAKILQLIYQEIEQLPPQCAAVFKAYFFQGKDTASIARDMNLSTQTVLNQKTKAINHLRTFLHHQGIFPMATILFPALFK